MKRVAVFLTVGLLMSSTAYVYSSSFGTKQHPRGVPQRQEKIYDSRGQLQQTIKRDTSGNQTVYDNRGQLQQTIKRGSSGNQTIYDSRGQLQRTIKRDPSGNEKVYDNRGQLREYIKPN